MGYYYLGGLVMKYDGLVRLIYRGGLNLGWLGEYWGTPKVCHHLHLVVHPVWREGLFLFLVW